MHRPVIQTNELSPAEYTFTQEELNLAQAVCSYIGIALSSISNPKSERKDKWCRRSS